MGLSVHLGENIIPVITCDTCGKPIVDIRTAQVATTKIFGQGTIPVHVFHRGKCTPSREEYPGTEELPQFLRKLVGNIHLGRIVTPNQRQIVIDLPEPDDMNECIGKLPW